MTRTAMGAYTFALNEVMRNLGVDALDDAQEAMVGWACGATLRYFIEAAPGPTPATVRINEPPLATTDLGGDPQDIAKARGYSGNMCSNCGGLNMVRTGTCETCQNCGGTSGGCS